LHNRVILDQLTDALTMRIAQLLLAALCALPPLTAHAGTVWLDTTTNNVFSGSVNETLSGSSVSTSFWFSDTATPSSIRYSALSSALDSQGNIAVPTALKISISSFGNGASSSTNYSATGILSAMSWISVPGQVPYNWSTTLSSFSGTGFNPLTFGLSSFGQSNLAGLSSGIYQLSLNITPAAAGISGYQVSISPVSPVPEPESIALLGVGLLCIGLKKRRQLVRCLPV
jgi:hypothetical protein